MGILLTEEDAYTFRTVANIAVTLEKKLGKNIDLHMLNGKDPRFLHTVLQHAIVLFSRDEERRISFEATVLSTYLDMKPFYKKFDARVKQRFT